MSGEVVYDTPDETRMRKQCAHGDNPLLTAHHIESLGAGVTELVKLAGGRVLRGEVLEVALDALRRLDARGDE